MSELAISPEAASLARKILRRENISTIPEADRFGAFAYLARTESAISPSSDTPTRAFNGFINIGALAGLIMDHRREAAFIAMHLRHLIGQNGSIYLTGPVAFQAACSLFGLDLIPEDDPRLTGTVLVSIKALNDTLGVHIALHDTSATEAACLASLGPALNADPSGLAQIEKAFSELSTSKAEPKTLPAIFMPEIARETKQISHVFDPWVPALIAIDTMQPHPAKLIEAKTLAAAKPVGLHVIPQVSKEAIASGAISDAELEAVTLAVNAHDRLIDISSEDIVFTVRQGFLLADGTGTGKSNTNAAILQHHWNCGRKRHILLVEKDGHVAQFRKALKMTKTAIPMHRFSQVRAGDRLSLDSGIVVLTYAMLRQTDENGEFHYLDMLIAWMKAAGPAAGVIVFDEAQELRNAPDAFESYTSIYTKEPSLQARAACMLQDSLPDCPVVYSSATAGSDLIQLAYMSRLGLWGPDAPYKSFKQFMVNHSLRTHAAEAIPLHLKANGLMACRTLSMEGVVYSQAIHILDTAQTSYYETFTALMAETKRLICETITAHAPLRSNDKPTATLKQLGVKDSIWSTRLSPYAIFKTLGTLLLDTIDTALAMPTALAAVNAALARDEAVVIQVSRTQEADTVRARNASISTSDSNTAIESMLTFLDTVLKPVADDVAKRSGNAKPKDDLEFLRKSWTELPPVMQPLDALISAYGPDRIAEVTGRTLRRVPNIPGNPTAGMRFEERQPAAALEEYEQFMDDRRDILIFSTGFGGSGYDFHAAKDCRNQRRRNHFILDVGSRADSVIQGIGRTHRNNQAVDPVVILISSDVPGCAIVTTRVRRSIANLGALSMGHREATNRSIFDGFDDFDSPAATQALFNTLREIKHGAYPEITSTEGNRYLSALSDDNVKIPTENTTLSQFKSLRFTPLSFQRRFLERYLESYNALPDAIRNQRTDGPYVVKTPMRVTSEQKLLEDTATGDNLTALTLAGDFVGNYATFEESMADAVNYCLPGETPQVRYKKTENRIMIQVRFDEFDPLLPEKPIWRVYTPDGVDVVNSFARSMLATAPLKHGLEPETVWEENTQRLRNLANAEKVLITGSLLKLTALLTATSFSRLVIIPTTDGRQIAGYIIDADMLDVIKTHAPEMARHVRDRERANTLTALDSGNRVLLDNAWMVRKQYLPQEILKSQLDENAGTLSPDPEDYYLTVTFPQNTHRKVKIWALRNQFIQFNDDTGPTTVLVPWCQSPDKIKTILAVASPSTYEF